MNQDHLINKIREVVADVTHTSLEEVHEDSGSHTLDAWDSVAQINIIVAVESEFGVSFSAEQLQALDSVAKIYDALARASV